MAKVEEPYDTFKATKRLGKRLLLKNRREGDIVNLQSLTKKMVFFRKEYDPKIKEELQKTWEKLTPDEKEKWKQLGEQVYMDGETLYKQQRKKEMTQGFYGIAVYGATRYKGITKTKYSTSYGEAIYGVSKYRGK